MADNGKMRKVMRREGNNIYYVTVEGGKERLCWIVTWSDWCRRRAFEPVKDEAASGRSSS